MEENRDSIIVRTSIVGIVANIFLAGFKAFIGLAVGSIAIVMDAVNNLSDVLSSVITIVGTKLAGKAPDREHPFGHGRVEYLSAMVIAVIVLYAGITSLVESGKKIIHPVTPEYTKLALIIVAVAVVVKILLGSYVKKTGEKVNSGSLIASGQDALMDSIISASTLVAAVIFIGTGLKLEAYLAAVISLVIVKAGIDMMKDAYSQILGERVDSDLAKEIKKTIASFDDVRGAYDLVMHSYGPDRWLGSVHIEVPDSMDAADIDALSRKITSVVAKKHGVIMTGIGIYSYNTCEGKAAEIRHEITRIASDIPYVLQVHGFYLDEKENEISFDVVVAYEAEDRRAVWKQVVDKVKEKYPEYKINVAMDSDTSD
jgi:cation diffusion facilitator family transporter